MSSENEVLSPESADGKKLRSDLRVALVIERPNKTVSDWEKYLLIEFSHEHGFKETSQYKKAGCC